MKEADNHKNIYPNWPQYISDIFDKSEANWKVQDYVNKFELALTQHNTHMHVRMFSPSSIAHAANLAKLHEASRLNLTGNRFNSQPNTSSFKPMVEVNNLPVGPFIAGHQLKHQKSQFLVMEMDDDEEPVDEEIEIIEGTGVTHMTTNNGDKP
ncbi:hypothetical protein CR513_24862, partial [Mucuna pruriens]